METCKSPRKVLQVAHAAACQCLPAYSSRFSRKDFTLPQLFACLVVKDLMKRSYRGAEALLRDSQSWLADIGMVRAPDHNTLCRAAKWLLAEVRVNRLLDVTARWAHQAGLLALAQHPLAIDSTSFDTHHVSRHYERRCQETRKRLHARDEQKSRKSSRSLTIRAMPKLALTLATNSHVILSQWTTTGLGSDHPHFKPLVRAARKRVPTRHFKVVGDAGYDCEATHQFARETLGLASLIPPTSGRPRKDGGPPGGRWRKVMKKRLNTARSRKKSQYTRRWQVETGYSMIKRNQGDALAGTTPASRRRDMRLRVLTHNLMILWDRVETEQITHS